MVITKKEVIRRLRIKKIKTFSNKVYLRIHHTNYCSDICLFVRWLEIANHTQTHSNPWLKSEEYSMLMRKIYALIMLTLDGISYPIIHYKIHNAQITILVDSIQKQRIKAFETTNSNVMGIAVYVLYFCHQGHAR